MSTVLVTGGSGFVASHVIVQLLEAGHRVRTTVRSAQREDTVRAMVRRSGQEPGERLTFHVTDLLSEQGWAEAVQGCDFVQHVASPMNPDGPRHEDELILPAREGSLRVLRFARDAGVKRVVFTSTCGAIYYGHPPRPEPFDETSWTVIGPELTAYVKSKALAERAVWDFMTQEGGALELSVVNPSGIFGPALGPDYSNSLELIRRLMSGMPGAPRIFFGVVDVRDVADLHLRAMVHPDAAGQRFIAVSAGGAVSMHDIAKVLRERLGSAARRVPRFQLPDWAVRLAARRDPAIQQLLPLLGKVRNATSAKAERVLGWKPRSREDAVTATAQSLLELGLVKA